MLETMRTILVPTDFTETSEGALQAAVGLAKRDGAELVVMHAYQIPIYSFPDGTYVSPANLAAELSVAAQRGLDAVVARLSKQGARVIGVLREGNADQEIRAVAHARGVDLVVVGTHGRHGLARALLGSVAEKVIRTLDVPVLVVRALAPSAAEG
jgi:nucleotide-binding universal stress UspA family protein